MKNLLPAYFHGMFQEVFLAHDHNTRQKNNPVPGKWKSIAAKNSIRFALPAAISNTPKEIIEKIDAEDMTLNGFSKLLKFFFIEQYQTECLIKNCYVCNDIDSSNKSSEDD